MHIELIFSKNHQFLVQHNVNGTNSEYIIPSKINSAKEWLNDHQLPLTSIGSITDFKIFSSSEDLYDFTFYLIPSEPELKIPGYSWLSIAFLSHPLLIPTHDGTPEKIPPEKFLEIYEIGVLEGFSIRDAPFSVWHFCMNEHDADKLAELVLSGTKRGTASLVDAYLAENEPFPKLGARSIITDFAGFPRCIIETVNVTITPFDKVSPEFAAIEGEGDKSLEYWRRVHIEFFTEEAEISNLSFNMQSKIILEEFRVVKTLKKK
ncbi:hypothetical protein NEF87_000491 [Candidatus Lokiarchaeum ossiferum]|uniref:ASCH domain-containing protein n=1 Tax=Candidatus Lokiarchaeum ossiferum TaxID=2951803 RepID=A0ABY6HNT3_9ARCH|nr:hypothetical protein NEF87_000491 [Candidatus Lokiarchaeum sp. B-35]